MAGTRMKITTEGTDIIWTQHNNSFLFDSPYWLLTRIRCVNGRKNYKIVAKFRMKYFPETII